MRTSEGKRLDRHIKRLTREARLGFGCYIVLVPVFAAFSVWQASIGNFAEAVVYMEIGGVAVECLRKLSRDSNQQLSGLLIEDDERSNCELLLVAADPVASVTDDEVSPEVSVRPPL